jgi:hypothetical protein
LILSPEEMQQLSSLTRNPTLWQHLQSVVWWALDEMGTPSMLSWLMANACDIWETEGEMPGTPQSGHLMLNRCRCRCGGKWGCGIWYSKNNTPALMTDVSLQKWKIIW